MADDLSTTRRPSAALLLMGLVALGISAWSLFGPGTFTWLTTFDGRWLVVAVAGVLGLALIFTPGLRGPRS